MSEESTASALARIEAGLGHLAGSLREVREDGKEIARTVGAMEGRMISLDERFKAHEVHDDSRFTEIREDTTRAHRKIADITSRHRSKPRDSGETPTSTKAGWVAGVIGALMAIAAAIAKLAGD